MDHHASMLARFAVLVMCGALGACSSEGTAAGPGDASTTNHADSSVTSPDGSSTTPDASAPTVSETALTLTLSLAITAPDAGTGSGSPSDGGITDADTDSGDLDAAPIDAGKPATDAGAPIAAKLTITATDGTTPVVTDLWLYTVDSAGAMTPITDFTSTAARKSPRLMLPATIAGKATNYVPADDGRMNGILTATSRGVLDGGVFVSTVSGKVVVSLPTVPTSSILVVAAIEDQRYYGAAVINLDGTPGTVPAGVGLAETHVQRTFDTDVAPILKNNCATCHKSDGIEEANLYLVTGTRDDLVNDNFALKESTVDCQAANPDGGAPLDACIKAITKAQFLVEPGAPAATDLLQRARPDDNGSTSDQGLLWYGSKGARYNAKYGDRRMPSTTDSLDAGAWDNRPTAFDVNPDHFQVLFDWVAQGAK